MMLEIVKMLLEINMLDSSKDEIINHYIDQALRMALSYCNVTELSTDYDATIADIAVYLYKIRDGIGYKQKTEGERSAIFESGGIPEYIKLSLPLPKIKVGAQDV